MPTSLMVVSWRRRGLANRQAIGDKTGLLRHHVYPRTGLRFSQVSAGGCLQEQGALQESATEVASPG